MRDVSNKEDLLDSRDVIEWLEELRDERQAIVDARDDTDASKEDMELAIKTLAEWDEENGVEFNALMDLDKEGDDYAPDWRHGASLIRDSYFKDYAQQLAEDIGAIPNDAKWPCNCIDWEEAAS